MGHLKKQKCVMIIAGEASGDLHGSKVVRAMRGREADLFFCGIGGQALKEAGVRIYIDASKLAVVGITEAFTKLFSIIKGITLAKKLLKTLNPDLLILIDFPDFNLHLAGIAKKLGIPVLYYISPQVWAWRRGRIKKIGKRVDHMAVILPFEEGYYRKRDIPVTFVGHPLLDTDLAASVERFDKKPEAPPVIGLMPGSRDKEIVRHLPIMLDAACILRRRIRNSTFVISLAPSVERDYVKAVLKHRGPSQGVTMTSDRVGKIFRQCQVVVAASGTVTLEAAISGTPMVIIYRVSAASYWLGRLMVRVEHIGLVNLIAGRTVVPELIQDSASAENIAAAVSEMIRDPVKRSALRKEILGVREALGGPGAAARVAGIAMGLLGSRVENG
jgi:lipid-A-disaccharide synthase